jgi:hypothetical protein
MPGSQGFAVEPMQSRAVCVGRHGRLPFRGFVHETGAVLLITSPTRAFSCMRHPRPVGWTAGPQQPATSNPSCPALATGSRPQLSPPSIGTEKRRFVFIRQWKASLDEAAAEVYYRLLVLKMTGKAAAFRLSPRLACMTVSFADTSSCVRSASQLPPSLHLI